MEGLSAVRGKFPKCESNEIKGRHAGPVEMADSQLLHQIRVIQYTRRDKTLLSLRGFDRKLFSHEDKMLSITEVCTVLN